jgi:4-diphosphocytidyl-2-C-methyl-D-erythritol kinase
MITEFAPAKVNLALHVTGRRADGYHLLDSLVVFAGVGDRVSVAPADQLSLSIIGPQAGHLPVTDDNLVLRAARTFGMDTGALVTLEKHLPIASGIGGGSADAAAALRALSAFWGQPLPEAAIQLALGADVPVCAAGRPARMAGVGEIVTTLPHPLPPAWLVLVNPGIALPTPTVFAALTNRDNPALPAMPHWPTAQELADWLHGTRNDLEGPAIATAPVIAVVKAAIAATEGCLLARMSGSGATCFGLYGSEEAAFAAADGLRMANAQWWVAAAPLLG